jgi:hypothetical protein
MADTAPVSTTVPENVTIDTGADKASIESLSSAFDDFWKSEDSKAETPEPPEAPAAGGETKPPKEEPKPETKPDEGEGQPPEPSLQSAKELSDDEIDKMQLIPGQRPEVYEHFKQVKEHWKADRAQLKNIQTRATQLETELAQARQNAWTPETKADYEHAAAIRRRFDYASDPEFIQKHQVPIRQQFETLLADVARVLPDPNQGMAWAQEIAQNYQPDQLSRDWWQNSVLAKIPDELNRAQARDQVTQLLKMQRDRDAEIFKNTKDKSAFDNFIQEKAATTQQRVQEEIMAEIGIQEKRIQEVMPRDVNAAKTAEERAAIEAHNERFTKLNTFFQNTMKDISANGPRAWVRASVEATRAMLLEGEYNELAKELKAIKAERDQYKTELDKIHGARKKIANTTGTPVISPEKARANGQGLSIKNLDVRTHFDNIWGEIDGTNK